VFTANISSPDKTIFVSEAVPGEILIETNNNFSSEDGTIGITKFSPTLTDLSNKIQVMGEDDSVLSRRIGNAFVLKNGMNYTSENDTIRIKRPNPTTVDFSAGHPPTVYANSLWTIRANKRYVSFFRFDPLKLKNIADLRFTMDAYIEGYENMGFLFRNSYVDEMSFDLGEGGEHTNSYYYRKKTPYFLRPHLHEYQASASNHLSFVYEIDGAAQGQNPSYGIGQLTAPEPLDQLCVLYLRMGDYHKEGYQYKYITRLTPLSDAAYDLFLNKDVEMKTEYWESSEIRVYNDFGYLSEYPLPYVIPIDDGNV
jgi:hypothetical protein